MDRGRMVVFGEGVAGSGGDSRLAGGRRRRPRSRGSYSRRGPVVERRTEARTLRANGEQRHVGRQGRT